MKSSTLKIWGLFFFLRHHECAFQWRIIKKRTCIFNTFCFWFYFLFNTIYNFFLRLVNVWIIKREKILLLWQFWNGHLWLLKTFHNMRQSLNERVLDWPGYNTIVPKRISHSIYPKCLILAFCQNYNFWLPGQYLL